MTKTRSAASRSSAPASVYGVVCAVSGKGTAGRRTVKVLPRPGPSLEVCTTTAMQFNQLTDQGETDAETVRPAIRTAPALHEEVKHARKNIRRDPIAVVPNLADGIAILAVHPDANRAACWRVFQGIADQVHKDLFKSDRIRVEQDGLGLDRDLVLLAFVFEVEGDDAVSGSVGKMAEVMPYSRNTISMKGATGPFGGYISLGGLFTIVKVRDRLKSYDEDPGWYQHAPGTVRSRRPMRILRETVLGQANTAGG